MKYYIKQKVFSWRDRFFIYDDGGNEIFHVEGEVFTFGKKLHLYDQAERELSYIHQKVWSFLPRFFVSQNGTDIAEVTKEFTWFKPRYAVEPFGYTVSGDFMAHNYTVDNGERTIASVTKKWFTWGDTYEIDISESTDAVMMLSIVLIIDAVLAQQSASSAGAASSSGSN